MNRDLSPNPVPQDGATAPEMPAFTQAQVEAIVWGYHLFRVSKDNLELVRLGYLESLPNPSRGARRFTQTAAGIAMGMKLRETFAEGTKCTHSSPSF